MPIKWPSKSTGSKDGKDNKRDEKKTVTAVAPANSKASVATAARKGKDRRRADKEIGNLLRAMPSISRNSVSAIAPSVKPVKRSSTSMVRAKPSATRISTAASGGVGGMSTAGVDTEGDIATEDAQTTLMDEELLNNSGEKNKDQPEIIQGKERGKLSVKYGDADEAAKMRAKKDAATYAESNFTAELFAAGAERDAVRLERMNPVERVGDTNLEIINEVLPSLGFLCLMLVAGIVMAGSIIQIANGLWKQEILTNTALPHDRYYQLVRFSSSSNTPGNQPHKCKITPWKQIKMNPTATQFSYARMVTVKTNGRLPIEGDCPPSVVKTL